MADDIDCLAGQIKSEFRKKRTKKKKLAKMKQRKPGKVISK